MQKQVSFWLGFFTASALVVTVAIGVWGIATERALSTIAVVFGMLLAFSVLLLLGVFARDRILRLLIGRAESHVEDIGRSSTELFLAASKGETDRASSAVGRLTQSVIGWYAWSSFYRWVVATNVALLVAFAGFAGTVLLFEQNKRLQEQTRELVAQRVQLESQNDRIEFQNELIGLSLVADLRERLRNSRTETFSSHFPYAQSESIAHIDGASENCHFFATDRDLKSTPYPSTLSTVAELAKSTVVGNRVIAALRHLILDDDDLVSLGALLVLDQLNSVPQNTHIDLSEMIIRDLEIKSEVSFAFQSSAAINFQCNNCKIRIYQSYLENFSADRILNTDSSYIAIRPFHRELRDFYDFDRSKLDTARWSIISEGSKDYYLDDSNTVFDICERARLIADVNSLLEFSPIGHNP